MKIKALLKSAAFVLLAVFLQNANADGAMTEAEASEYISTITSMKYDSTDLADVALANLFGGFVFEPFGGGPSNPPTALAIVLGYSNILAMILGVVIVSYVMFAGALNTAASGEVLGKQWSSVWLPLRVTVAFGMIMPAGGEGKLFSVAQYLVMSLIIIGSNSATWLWQKGADALKTGSPVMASSAVYSSTDYQQFANLIYCASIVDKLKTEKDDEEPEEITVKFRPGTDDKHMTYAALSGLSLTNVSSIDFGKCGSISIPTATTALDNTTLENQANENASGLVQWGQDAFYGKKQSWEEKIQKNFNTSVAPNLKPVIDASINFAKVVKDSKLNLKSYSALMAEGKTEATGIETKLIQISAAYLAVGAAYDTYIANVQGATINADVQSDWAASMTTGGWARAGAWFFEASRLQGYAQNLMTNLSTVATYKAPTSVDTSCSFLQYFGSSCKQINEDLASWLGMLTMIQEKSSIYAGNSGSNSSDAIKLNGLDPDGKIDAKFTENFSVAVAQMVLNTLMSWGSDDAKGLAGQSGNTQKMTMDVSGMISPFTAVSSLGRGLQQISVTTWSIGLAAAAILGLNDNIVTNAVAGVVSGGAAGPIAGVIKYIMATMSPVLMGVSGLSFMLAFAIPFMPVTIWIMQVCGYFVTVIEAVASAPLAVVMLATPEGDGMTGRNFNVALQMINAIVLKPSLSIIGLFAAMTLSYIGFMVMNSLFWSVASMTTAMSIFEIMALIFIYATTAYKMCTYMVQIIHDIPNHILEWMGGGRGRSFGEKESAQGMSEALSRNAAAGGLALGAAGMSLGQAAKDRAVRSSEPKKPREVPEIG